MWIESKQDYELYLGFEKAASENTRDAYTRDLNIFLQFLGENYDDLSPKKVNLSHIEEFMSYVYDLGLSSSSQARILSGIKAFFKYLILEEVITENPTDLIEGPKLSRKIPDTLSVEEVELMLNSLDLSKKANVRNKAMLETLYGCGLRVSELTDLQISCLFFEEGFIKVIGKGDKERLVPIGDSAIKYIQIYLDTIRRFQTIDPKHRDILFLNRRGKKLTRVMVFMMIKELAQTAGIHKSVSPHTFRHSFATHLIEGGAGLRAVQQMLGHQSITTTEIYTHVDQTHLRDTMIMHHPRFQN
ncbi:MAG: site-specific tyrosine recombinase XerD [Bacteroidetes bacterium]|nr:site-specific tyrosine recombinase XerD [Bacteroidota bacterium]